MCCCSAGMSDAGLCCRTLRLLLRLLLQATLLQSIRDSLLKAEGCKEGMVEAFKTIHADHK